MSHWLFHGDFYALTLDPLVLFNDRILFSDDFAALFSDQAIRLEKARDAFDSCPCLLVRLKEGLQPARKRLPGVDVLESVIEKYDGSVISEKILNDKKCC